MSDFIFKKEVYISEIMDNFDFIAVNDVMMLMDWKWAMVGVPTVSDLIATATKLLNDVYDSDEACYMYSSTGGFKASKYNGVLELEFIISDYSTESLNYGDEYEKVKKVKNRREKINIIDKNENN